MLKRQIPIIKERPHNFTLITTTPPPIKDKPTKLTTKDKHTKITIKDKSISPKHTNRKNTSTTSHHHPKI
jgi:hypothetical protein